MILDVCSAWYVFKLISPCYVNSLFDVPVFFFSSWFIRWRFLDPMLAATDGTIAAAYMAIQNGWAINLGGGAHHASFNRGGGFCVYPDLTFAIHYVRKYMGIKKVMIVDLDAHQGNGHGRDFIGDKNTFIVDCYNPTIYPGDEYAKQAIQLEILVGVEDTDESYLSKIEKIEQSIESFEPELIVYNAGTDILEGDSLSKMRITPGGIMRRDEFIFRLARERFQIPILMVLSGGFEKKNAQCVSDSLVNLVKRFNLSAKN